MAATDVLHATRSAWKTECHSVEPGGRVNNVMLVGAGLDGFIRAGGKT